VSEPPPIAVASWIGTLDRDRALPPLSRRKIVLSVLSILLSAVIGWGLVRLGQIVWSPTQVTRVDHSGMQRRPPAPPPPPTPPFRTP
jgi:hypothetical protein